MIVHMRWIEKGEKMMNKTYRIEAVKGEPLATGYKIFNWDWTGAGDYCYADGGELEGSVHTVDGDLSPCAWGLHFCKNPVDCLNFKEPVQWNRFAKVSAFDEIVEADNGKTVARTLRIDKVLTWDEFVQEIKQYGSYIYGGSDIYGVFR